MSSEVSLFSIALSILLPWILGGVWVYCLLGSSRHWNWWLILGHGYLAGLFLTTLVLRFVSSAGWGLSFTTVATILLLLTLAGAITARKLSASTRPVHKANALGSGEWVFCGALLLLLGWRYSTIFQEVLLRPLYPWDAWMNWAPKAVVWFHFREMVDYVHPQAWLTAPASALDYTLGAYNAWEYPDGVPLIQLWSMLAIGSADQTAIYLPWVFISIALGCSLYGHLRMSGTPCYIAMTGVYLLLSQPFINVHTALAGYADLWVTAVFGCSVFAVIAWDETRNWQYAVLALVSALFCAQLKVPGIIMAGIALGLLAVSLPGIARPRLALLLGVIAVGGLAAFLLGLQMELPGLGPVVISQEMISLPFLGDYPLQYRPIHDAMLTSNFLMINWNIFWFLVCFAAAIALAYPAWVIRNLLVITAPLTTIGFVIFVYYFTERYEFAQDYTQVNRATLYSIPLAALFLCRIGAHALNRSRA